MTPIDYLLTVILAFSLEIVDASLGMGYGTILTPILLIMGFEPLNIVPAILISQLAGDFLGAFFHHEFKNCDLSIGSKSFRIATVLALLSSIGAIIGVAVAVSLPKYYLTLYIGALVTIIGIVVLVTVNKNYGFSWPRLLSLGSLAAFNKGISGGGYGPIVTGGQLLAGVEAKNAIGITSLAEGIVCIVSIASYILLGKRIDWLFSLLLTLGVAFSTPLSAYLVSKMQSTKLKFIIGAFTLLVGLLTVFRMASA